MFFNFWNKSLSLLLKRQTNILSAALVLMLTVVLGQFFGLIRYRLLVGIFGASNTLGVYLASSKLPDFLFQLIIAGALSSAFIPVFTDYLVKGKSDEANKMASTLLLYGLSFFIFVSIFLFIFAPQFLVLVNLGSGFSPSQMSLMANLMRIMIVGQIIFLIGTFFSSLLQSHNHFIIPGIALSTYNLGIIIGIIFLSKPMGIFAPAYGVIIGAAIYTLLQLPLVRGLGFKFSPSLSIRKTPGVMEVGNLMWPRTLSLLVFQLGTIITLSLISFIPPSGRNYVIFDYAQTIFFAPIALFGQTVATAALPILSREKGQTSYFRSTFLTSYNQVLYLVLPVSVLILVLRIPIVRLIFGTGQFDWQATVLTGRTLAFFALSIFAQALVALISKAFYALQDTKTPLIIGGISTLLTIILSVVFIYLWNNNLINYYIVNRFRLIPQGVEGIALAYTIGGIVNLVVLLIYLNKKIGGIFSKEEFILPQLKIFVASLFTAVAIYIPIKLLDQLVFDTTKTINLILLAGISSLAGLLLYLFLTWLFDVKEATTFLLLFKKLGNWKEILQKANEL